MIPRKWTAALFVATLMFGVMGVRAYAQPPIPEHQGRYVVDQAGVIDDGLEADLNQRLKALDDGSAHDAQAVVLTMPDCGGDENSYATKVFEKYQPGKDGTDRGLLMLVCMQERRFRVETGYGLEGAIPDLVAKGAVDEFTAQAKKGDFGGGISAALTYLEPYIRGELDVVKLVEVPTQQSGGFPLWLIIIFVIFVVLAILFVLSLDGSSSGGSGGGYYGGGGSSGGDTDGDDTPHVPTYVPPVSSPPRTTHHGSTSPRRRSSSSSSSSRPGGGFGGFGGGGFRGGGGRSGGGGASGGW